MSPDGVSGDRHRCQIGVACAAVFAVLTLAVTLRWTPFIRADRSLDERTNVWAVSHHTVVRAAMLVSDVARPESFEITAAVVVVALLFCRRWRAAARIATATLAGMGAGAAAKALVRRPRPLVGHPFAHPHGFSFPSSHALTAATAVSVYILVLIDSGVGSRTKHALGLAGSVLAATVAASRVLLGVHYLSDVLAGLALGLALACASVLVWRPEAQTPVHGTSSGQPISSANT